MSSRSLLVCQRSFGGQKQVVATISSMTHRDASNTNAKCIVPPALSEWTEFADRDLPRMAPARRDTRGPARRRTRRRARRRAGHREDPAAKPEGRRPRDRQDRVASRLRPPSRDRPGGGLARPGAVPVQERLGHRTWRRGPPARRVRFRQRRRDVAVVPPSEPLRTSSRNPSICLASSRASPVTAT